MKAQNIPYVKVEGDPKKQAEALRKFFPGTGSNVSASVPKPTQPLSDDVEMQRLDLGYQGMRDFKPSGPVKAETGR